MKVTDEVWDIVQERLDYSDEEMKLFKENPRNEDVISKAREMLNRTIVAEVVESHGCSGGFKVGDKIIFDGAGRLVTKLNPKRLCIFGLGSLQSCIYAMSELYYAGSDPNDMRFNRAGCQDVGLSCQGWGRTVFELRVEDRPQNQ